MLKVSFTFSGLVASGPTGICTTVSVRFSASELEVVQAHAVEAGTSVSGYLRNLALATAQQPVVTMTWIGTATQNLPTTQERILVRSSPSQFPWLPGTSLVIDR